MAAAAFNDKAVFINCPFDDPYKPIFDSIVFTITDPGFEARHALIDDATPIRLARIVNEIERAKYTIHDLSRVEASGKMKLPRFNMPFEAGLAYCVQHSDQTRQRHFLLLDKKPYQYLASLSDAAGLDPKIHKDDPNKAIGCVRQFLATKSGKANMPGEAHISSRYALFLTLLPAAADALHITMDEIRSWDYVNALQLAMQTWSSENPP